VVRNTRNGLWYRLCAWRRHDTLDRKCHRTLAGGLSCRCECAGELRSDTSRTRTHRLLPKPKSVLSWTIGSCRCQSARAIRRRVVSSNYWNRPSETQTTSATPLIHRCTVYRPCWYGSRYYSGADRRRMQWPKENPSDVSSSQTTNGSLAPSRDIRRITGTHFAENAV
jgi:hypothetical protein